MDLQQQEYVHPLDIVADEAGGLVAEVQDGMIVFPRGQYQFAVTWVQSVDVLHFACGFGLKFSRKYVQEMWLLESLINDVQRAGHFQVSFEERIVQFCYGHLLPPDTDFSPDTCRFILDWAYQTCDRYALTFAEVASGKNAQECFEFACRINHDGAGRA